MSTKFSGQNLAPSHRIALILVLAVLSGSSTKAQQKSGGAERPQIIGGTVISAENTGAVLITSDGFLCSGTLLSNEWALAAAHCHFDVGTPSNIAITMGSQSTTGVFAVTHPSLDFALVKFSTPFKMNGSTSGYRVSVYADSTQSLSGKTVRVWAYGCNAYNGPDPEQCTGDDGTLRQAFYVVKNAPVDDFSFSLVVPNSAGQSPAPGDSGSGAFVLTPQGYALAGVFKGPDEQRPENWRDWALSYVNGTPIALPTQWFIGGNNPTFLKSPLPNNDNDSHTWNPCPGSTFSYSPTFNLEKGNDFISIVAGGSPLNLSGSGTTICKGSGAITVTLKTNGSNRSVGLSSMPITCNYAGPSSEMPITNVSPAVVGVGDTVYFFAVTSDHHVMYKTAQAGQAGLCWEEVEGNGVTMTAPGAGAVGSHVFVAVRQPDGSVALNQSDLGKSFGQWFPQTMVTDATPSAVGVGDNIYLFAKSLDGRIMFNRAKLGQAFVGWMEVQGGGRTDAAPVAGAVGTHVFVAIKGLDGKVAVNQADLGQPFGQWFAQPMTTMVAPAALGVGTNIYLFATATDGRVMVNRAELGQAFIGWQEVQGGGRTNSAPAAGAVGTHIFLAIKSQGGSIQVNQADLGNPFGYWF
jgi:hypothetical protein